MKRYLLIAASSLLLLLCLTPITLLELTTLARYGEYDWKFVAANISYCLLTYYLLRNSADNQDRLKVAIVLSLPIFVVLMPIHIIHFKPTMRALPSSVAHLTGIGAGLFLAMLSNIRKAIFLPTFIGVSVWLSISAYPFWQNKSYWGTFTGAVNEAVLPFVLTASDGQAIPSTSLKGQYVVLDFWNTHCTTCFKKFPTLERYHTRYRNNARVKFFAVNVPSAYDKPGQALQTIRKKGYTFPVVLVDGQPMASALKVDSYPTVLVLDPSHHIIYRGGIENLDQSLDAIGGLQ